jgi:ADP-ribosyl-[dinitrogen reductase] hydrolase
MLLEIAVGDAYGAGMEYVEDAYTLEHNHLGSYVAHPRHQIAPGAYTDDTQLSIAIAEAILDYAPWTKDELADRFVATFARDPRQGYASRFYELLLTLRDGAELLDRIDPRSDKSGAAMRAVPIGVFPSVDEVVARCTLQATVTHDTPEGISAACAAALSAHYFLHKRGPRDRLGRFLAASVPGPGGWDEPWEGKVGAKGWMSVRAAVTAIEAHDSMSEILRACVAFTGDVDTVAAIAMGAASCAQDVVQDLPQALLDGLEDGAYGATYLRELDARLAELCPALVRS